MLHLSGLAHVTEARSGGERDRSGAGEDFGRVVEKNFVDYVRGERGPIDRRAAFDHQAGDFKFAKTAQNRRKIGTSVGLEGGHGLDAHAEGFELRMLLRVGGGAKDQDIAVAMRGHILYEPGVSG